MVGAPVRGDVMKLQIKVNDEGIIEDARFKTYGCTRYRLQPSATEWAAEIPGRSAATKHRHCRRTERRR